MAIMAEETTLDTQQEYNPFAALDQRKKITQYIIIGVVAVVVAVVGGYIYTGNKKDDAQKAALHLSRIRPYYDMRDFARAIDGVTDRTVRGEQIVGLKYIADMYGSVEPGKVAALLTAQAFVGLDKYQDAQRYFDMATGSDAGLIQVGGYAGLGAVASQANNFAEAAKQYEKAAQISKGLTEDDQYQLFAAMMYEKSGNKEQALKLYRGIILQNEFAETANEAKAGIVRLGEHIQ